MNKRNIHPGIVAALLLVSASAVTAESNNWDLVPQEYVPRIGTFYLLSLERHGIPGPPFPNSLCSTCNIYSHGDGVFAVNDAGVADPTENLARLAAFLETMGEEQVINSETLNPEESSGGQGTGAYGPDDLWLEILSLDSISHLADLRLHGTIAGDNYQLESTTNLLNSTSIWELGRIQFGDSATNHTDFLSVPVGSTRQRFFRAHHANQFVQIETLQDAVEDIQQDGQFVIYAPGLSSNLTVYYRIGGVAENGIDYVDANTLTNLSGVVTVPAATGAAILDLLPTQDNIVEFEESVTLTIIPTNTYLIKPNLNSATITISDTTNYFVAVVTNVPTPIGIGYHAPSNSLVISYHQGDNGNPNAFMMVNSSGGILTNWSEVNGLLDEVKLTIVQTGGVLTNTAGFTNGDMYFGNDTQIGWLSADGTRSNLYWCTLTNVIVTNPFPLRGSLGMDETGVWGNELLAVASDGLDTPSDKGVWRINIHQEPTLITNIYTRHLEGIVALTNLPSRWGPWAGKIITGDESVFDENGLPNPLIYAIDTNGTVASFALDVEPEDFDVIQTNQDLYCVDFQGASSTILKLSQSLLHDYVGDLLITQAGEIDPAHPSRLFIVHWDSTNATFVKRSITIPPKYGGRFEHVTFAPINLPPVD